MKNIYIFIVSIFITPLAFAQEYKNSFDSNTSSNHISIMIEGGELNIEGHSGNEVIIVADGYEAPPEKAKGLVALYSNGRQDNSGVGLSVSREGNKMQLVSVGHQEIDYIIKVPDQSSINLQVGPRNDEVYIKNIKGEIEVKGHSDDIELEGISGPVVANSISGDIKVTYSQMTSEKPSAISIVSGDVDVYLPSTAKVNLKLSSISGEVYTDFNIEMKGKLNEDEENYGMRKPINGAINGGGTPIQISTVSGNIYLRKKD